MLLLPIVERELRVRSRQGMTYWVRTALAAFATFICLQQLSFAEALGGAGSPGQITFRAMAVLAFAICCFGFLATSDAISRERREQTLGLLVLTSVKGGDVLAGKLLSALLLLATALLAFVPVLMLPVLAGGVTGSEATQTAAVLGNTLFLSLALGLQASARHTEWFRAFRAALVWMLGWLFVPMVLDRLFQQENFISLLSPVAGMSLTSQNKPGLGWVSMGLVQLIAWTALINAWFAMKKATRDTVAEPVAALPRSTFSSDASVARSGSGSAALTAADPLRWLFRRQRGVRGMIWIATGISVVSYVIGPVLSFFGRAMSVWMFIWPLMTVITMVSGVLFAWAASRFFFEARRSGELEMLLTTPLGATRIVSANWAHLRRALRWPVVVLVLLTSVQYWSYGWQRSVFSGPIFPGLLAMISCANMIVGLAALCWAAMYFGSRAQSQVVAVAKAVGLVRGVPYLFYFLWQALAGWSVRFQSNEWHYIVYSVTPNTIVLVFWLILIVRLRRKLMTENMAVVAADAKWWLPKFFKGKSWRQIRHWTPSS